MPAGQRPNPEQRRGSAWAPLQKAEIEALLGTRPVAKTDHFVLYCLSPKTVTRELCTEVAPDRDDSVDNISALQHIALRQGFAAVVPKRHAKHAVTRNLIRRQAREAVRADASLPPDSHVLIRLRGVFDGGRYPAAASQALRAAVRQELAALLAQRRPAS